MDNRIENNASSSVDSVSNRNDAYASFAAQIATHTLSEYDAQIKTHGEEQKKLNEEKAQVRRMQQDMSTVDGGVHREMDASGNVTAYVIPFNTAAAEAWVDYKKIRGDGFKPNEVLFNNGQIVGYQFTPDQYKSFKDYCDNRLQDLNSQSEIKMIQFQGLLDARKQSLLQFSNMVSSNHETLMEIIRNMKG